MSRRVYLGRLPPDVTKRDVEKNFEGYGTIVDCRIMGGFGFLEFDSPRDADEVCRNFNNKPFLGGPDIIVEPAKENPRRRDVYEGGGAPRAGPRGGRGIRVLVKGISADVSWQDLKDFGREGGAVSFADVDRMNPGVGILEYSTMGEAETAVARLRELEIRGAKPQVDIDDAPPPPPRGDYRDDYRRAPPPRDDYYRRDRSPPRGYDDRRGGYDDRRGGGYDDRRGGGGGGYGRDRSPPRRDRSPPRRDPRDDYARRDRSPPRRDERRDDREREPHGGDRDRDRGGDY